MMNIEQLKVLIAIADGEGIAGAAKSLHISQPAVSKRLVNLEEELNISLLDRSEYRLRLTEPGKVLLRHARLITNQVNKAVEDLKLLIEKNQQLIRYNASPSVLPLIVPRALQQARKSIPNLSIEFCGDLIASSEYKVAQLLEGVYDLLIYPINKGINFSECTYEPLINIKMLLMASRNHPATLLKKPTLLQLRDYDWLFPSGEALPRQLIEDAFRSEKVDMPINAITLPLRQMQYTLLQEGSYLAFTPYHKAIMEDYSENLEIIDVDIHPMAWTIYLIQRSSEDASSAMHQFKLALKRIVAEFECS